MAAPQIIYIFLVNQLPTSIQVSVMKYENVIQNEKSRKLI